MATPARRNRRCKRGQPIACGTWKVSFASFGLVSAPTLDGNTPGFAQIFQAQLSKCAGSPQIHLVAAESNLLLLKFADSRSSRTSVAAPQVYLWEAFSNGHFAAYS